MHWFPLVPIGSRERFRSSVWFPPLKGGNQTEGNRGSERGNWFPARPGVPRLAYLQAGATTRAVALGRKELPGAKGLI